MKWKFCEFCYINGHCENQDKGHKCECYGKKLEDKCERLEKQLKIAVEALGLIDKRKCHMANCLQNCPLRKYYEKDKGCATCLNKACHTALQQIKDLEK